MTRKPKLSGPRDMEFYSQSYIVMLNGRKCRVIDGSCMVCGGHMTVMWSNFAGEERGRKGRRYTFIHKKCSDAQWRAKLQQQRLAKPMQEVYDFIYRKYLHGARRRGYAFDLTFTEFSDLIKKPCHYCGRSPRPHDHWSHVVYNGLDRADNSQGYTLQNSVTCCTICNFIKKDTELHTWNDFLTRVKNHVG